jgi:hypothetical protein
LGKQPLYAAYAVQRKNGIFEHGDTNLDGHTHLLASIAFAEDINVYLQDNDARADSRLPGRGEIPFGSIQNDDADERHFGERNYRKFRQP